MMDEGPGTDLDEIVGDTPQLKQVLQLAMKVAGSDTPVLILGEPGSGRELIARAVHRISPRRHESFVTVNCASPGERSLASHLFGEADEVGKPTIGQLEVGHKGVLFLNEIAVIPLSAQTKLVRLLGRREFERLGSTHRIPANVRLIASTKYDLGERVAEATFVDVGNPLLVDGSAKQRSESRALVIQGVEVLGEGLELQAPTFAEVAGKA